MSTRSQRITAATVGVALAAGAVSATEAAARRARLRRTGLDGIDALEVDAEDPFTWAPDRMLTVATDDGIDLHVEVDEPPGWAGGPTIVFNHGFCLHLGSWIHQRRAAYRAGYRCVLWDQRGHGRSAMGEEDAATIDQLGRDLAAVIDATTPEGPLVLVGHSMGGMTVMALADHRPDLIAQRVEAVAFVATSAGGGGMISLGFGRFLGAAVLRVGPGFLANLAARQRVWKAARRVGRDLESALVERFSFASPVSEDTVRYSAEMLLGTELGVIGAFLPAFEDHDKRAALGAFAGLPTLVLNGEEDVLTPPEHSLAIVDALPGSEHVVITDAGHLVMLEHPALLDAQLLALVDRVAVPHTPAKGPSRRREVTDFARRATVERFRTSRAKAKAAAAPSAKAGSSSTTAPKSRGSAKTRAAANTKRGAKPTRSDEPTGGADAGRATTGAAVTGRARRSRGKAAPQAEPPAQADAG